MRVVHRYWEGPPMPTDYREYGRRWAELNPGWKVKDWGPSDLFRLRNQDVYDDIGWPNPMLTQDPIAVATQRADVASYEILWQHGGIYVNCDIEPLKPLDGLLERVGDNPWASFEDAHFLVNAAMGGPPLSPFFDAVIRELPKRYWASRRGEMNTTTGPHLLTAVWRQWPYPQTLHGFIENPAPPFVTVSKSTFNPVHFSAVPIGGIAAIPDDLHPDTIGVHHWGHRRTGRSNLTEQ